MSEPPSRYRPPVGDILRALDVAGLGRLLELPDFSHVSWESVSLVLGEFGRFAAERIAPTDRPGDEVGSRLEVSTGAVVTPGGLAEVHSRYVKSGWGALQFPERVGGGGFPSVVGLALQEIFASANLALSLNPVLTQGAIELLLAWGDEAQRSTYLPRLLTGEWTGTMDLTEPEAGSDLGAVATFAERQEDGGWRVSGTKVFITWGDHDLAGNIIHLVLARTPGAPAGTKGLSLFLVPKFLVGADGTLGSRNRVRCARLEHKLGIHASPTCVMELDAAAGTLVGEEHGGLKAMFTMMNVARLSIGIEGPAIAEAAFQQARSYAQVRLQGRASGVAAPARSAIIEHPDVQRMLLSIRTGVQAGRLLLYRAAAHGDRARHDPDPAARRASQSMADLLTPIAKAWATDNGFAGSSLAVQVLGGVGYVEEAGVAQHLRDSRIPMIYEGTNGIQAIDLVTRKIGRDNGAAMSRLLDEIAATAAGRGADREGAGGTGGGAAGGAGGSGPLTASYEVLEEARELLQGATRWMVERLASAPDDALAGATSYLELAGLTIGGWLMLRRALAGPDLPGSGAAAGLGAGSGGTGQGDPGAGGVVEQTLAAESDYFALEHVARASGLLRPIMGNSAPLRAATAPWR